MVVFLNNRRTCVISRFPSSAPDPQHPREPQNLHKYPDTDSHSQSWSHVRIGLGSTLTPGSHLIGWLLWQFLMTMDELMAVVSMVASGGKALSFMFQVTVGGGFPDT